MAFLPHFWIVHALKLTFVDFLRDFSRFAVQHQKPWGFFLDFSIGPKEFFSFFGTLAFASLLCYGFLVHMAFASHRPTILVFFSSPRLLRFGGFLIQQVFFGWLVCSMTVLLDWKRVLQSLIFWSVKYCSVFTFTGRSFSPLYRFFHLLLYVHRGTRFPCFWCLSFIGLFVSYFYFCFLISLH